MNISLCYRYGSLLPQEREKLGYWSKNLIDYGRLCFLKKYGFDAELVAYVDQSYTIENTALMATRKQSTQNS